MVYYLKFALNFLYSYYFHKTYSDKGYLPFKQSFGCICKVIEGGQFKFTNFYCYTKQNGWLLIESDEAKVKETPEYKNYQDEITKNLREFNAKLDPNGINLPKYIN